jgi:hypothetical protein
VIGVLVAKYVDKKTYIEDYYWNHEEEVSELLTIKAEKELVKRRSAKAAKAAKTEKKKRTKKAPAKDKAEGVVTFTSKENTKISFPDRVRKTSAAPEPSNTGDIFSGLIVGDGVDYAGRKYYYDPKDKTGGVDPFYFENNERKYYES